MLTRLLCVTCFLMVSTPTLCEEGIVHLLLKAPVTVRGSVVDSANRPVSNVVISHLAREGEFALESYSVRSDSSGRFQFQTIGPAFVLRKDGFKSKLIRVSNGMSTLTVVLDKAPVPKNEGVHPDDTNCSSLGPPGVFCFPRIDGVEIGSLGGSVDAVERLFTVTTASTHAEMIHGAGPSWGGPYPRDEEIWGSVKFEESTRMFGDTLVIDAHGQTADGRLWRYVGIHGESAFYFGAEPEAATLFDRVLDGLQLVDRSGR